MRIEPYFFTSHKPVTPKDKQTARANPNNTDAVTPVSNPNYQVETADVTLARANPNSWFTFHLVGRQDYSTVTPQDIQVARANLGSHFAFYITMKPEYPISEQDKRIARQNPNTRFAEGLGMNPKYPLDAGDYTYIIDTFNSHKGNLQVLNLYMIGLLRHPSYQIHPEIIEVLRADFEENLAYNFGHSLLENPSYIIGEPEIKFARESVSANKRSEERWHIDKISAHPNYPITDDDIRLAREYPNSHFAEGLVQNPNFKVSDDDRHLVVIKPETLFALALVDRTDYVPTAIEVNFVRSLDTYTTSSLESKRNIDSELAFKLISNVFYPLSPVEILIALYEPESKLAEGLKSNLTYMVAKVHAKKESASASAQTTEQPGDIGLLELLGEVLDTGAKIGYTLEGWNRLASLFKKK